MTAGVRVSLGLPVERVEHGAEFVDAGAIAGLARTYEALGVDAAYVTDHPAPDARWLAAGGHQAMEPTVALAVAAAATTELMLHTNVYVAPYRNPFLSAKALASLDVVSGGRLIVGVAAGYLRPEFAALGADFDRRAELLDESLEMWPRIWTGEQVEVQGLGFAARSVVARPVPSQRPGPPIWVGGNSFAAMRRSVRHGAGWSPFPTPVGAAAALRTAAISDVSTLQQRIVRLGELSEQAGRETPPIVCFVPFCLTRYLDHPDGTLAELVKEVGELAEIGVDWVALSVPGSTRSQVEERAAALVGALGVMPRS